MIRASPSHVACVILKLGGIGSAAFTWGSLPHRRVDEYVFLDMTSIRTSGGDLSSGQFVFPGWSSDGGQLLIC